MCKLGGAAATAKRIQTVGDTHSEICLPGLFASLCEDTCVADKR